MPGEFTNLAVKLTKMKRRIPFILILIVSVGLLWAIAMYHTPMTGDDLGKYCNLHDAINEHNLFGIIYYMGRHVLGCNARLGDVLCPPLMFFLPVWLRSLVSGVGIATFFLVACQLAGLLKRNYTSSALLLTATLGLILPFWDSMTLYVCQFGYIWSAIFGILFLILFFNNLPDGKWWVLVFLALGWLAGEMHESVGVPLCCGMLWYFIVNRKDVQRIDKQHKTLLLGLAIGTFIIFLSPAFWHRVESDSEPNDTLLILALKNTGITLILGIVIAIGLIVPRWRASMWLRLKGKWGVIAIAALTGMAISEFSGIVGRPGWFSQTLAVIDIWLLMCDTKKSSHVLMPTLATLGALGLMWVNLMFCIWQVKMGNESAKALALYKASTNGQIYMDRTSLNDVPAITLGRVHGMPDADDIWLLKVYRDCYGDTTKLMRVLPTALEGTSRPDTIQLPKDMSVIRDLPKGVRQYDLFDIPLILDGMYTLTKFTIGDTIFYFRTPIELQPGDRLP